MVFLEGIFLGSMIGVFCMALCYASARAEREMEYIALMEALRTNGGGPPAGGRSGSQRSGAAAVPCGLPHGNDRTPGI